MALTILLGDLAVDEAKLKDLCRRYAVKELSVFGSANTGRMRTDSDVDLLVEFLPEAGADLLRGQVARLLEEVSET